MLSSKVGGKAWSPAACVESERSTLDEIQELRNAPPVAMAKAPCHTSYNVIIPNMSMRTSGCAAKVLWHNSYNGTRITKVLQ